MEHVVFYPSAQSLPSFRRVSSLDEAVIFVEHLRNVENITEFSVHALTAVPLAFRAYYRAEVPAAEGQAPVEARDEDRSAAWVAEAAVVEAPVATTSVVQPSAAVDAPVPDLFAVPAASAAILPTPFADAPPVTPADVLPESADAEVPSHAGRRSTGFFTR